MKKDNDEVLAGKIAFTARSSCNPAGVPGFDLFGFQPLFFLQAPNEVTMIFSGDQQVRHVYLGVPHSLNPAPSWYGESVGHYEGDTLVIDTIGLNLKTFVDNHRTPHTEKLHVVERWKLIEDGKALEVTLKVDDPDTYNEPWSAIQHFRRADQPMLEEVCAEGNSCSSTTVSRSPTSRISDSSLAILSAKSRDVVSHRRASCATGAFAVAS